MQFFLNCWDNYYLSTVNLEIRQYIVVKDKYSFIHISMGNRYFDLNSQIYRIKDYYTSVYFFMNCINFILAKK